ncbi:hypothetical protein IJT17_08435 [bacterium]|nr:hypothetical protein [bacterium]
MSKDAKILTEKAQSILDRLEKVFKEQGLTITISRLENSTLYLNIERWEKGLPVQFMAKAIGGTFRRYLPAIQQVEIDHFERKAVQPDDEQTAPKPLFSFNGIPELDMNGISPNEAMLALDNFASLVRRHSLNRFRINWKDRVEAATVLPRWVRSVNACMHQQGEAPGIYIVHIPAVPLDSTHDPLCGVNEAGDSLPARIMINMPRQPEAIHGLDSLT